MKKMKLLLTFLGEYQRVLKENQALKQDIASWEPLRNRVSTLSQADHDQRVRIRFLEEENERLKQEKAGPVWQRGVVDVEPPVRSLLVKFTDSTLRVFRTDNMQNLDAHTVLGWMEIPV